MIQSAYLLLMLVGSIISNNMAKEIFQLPGDSNIKQIKGTSTPWVLPDLIPIIEEFKNNVFEDLKASPSVKKIWDVETASKDARDIFFTLVNQYGYDLGHPAPAALANIVSKSGSLFESLTMPIYFEAYAIHLAEFLLSKDTKIDRDTAKKAVDFISKELEGVDPNKKESIFSAVLAGYGNFLATYGFDLSKDIDELLELFSSAIIVLHDK